MKYNINDLYIGQIGKFTGFKFINGNAHIDYDVLHSSSLYVKEGNKYRNIFTDEVFASLDAYSAVPKKGVGIIEPSSFCDHCPDYILNIIDKFPMFSLNELKAIEAKLELGANHAAFKIEDIIENRKQEMEI